MNRVEGEDQRAGPAARDEGSFYAAQCPVTHTYASPDLEKRENRIRELLLDHSSNGMDLSVRDWNSKSPRPHKTKSTIGTKYSHAFVISRGNSCEYVTAE